MLRVVEGGSPPVTPPSRSDGSRSVALRRRRVCRAAVAGGSPCTRSRHRRGLCRGVSRVSRAIFFLSKPRHVYRIRNPYGRILEPAFYFFDTNIYFTTKYHVISLHA